MLGFKSFIVEGIADANSLMTHDSKLRSAGYTRVGSFSHPTSGNQIHTYQTGKGKNIHTTHLHVKQGVVHKTESHAGRPDLIKVKQSLGEDAIEETLPADAKASDYIHDFVHSKNKTFKGDSKKERIKRALGAYYGHQKEEEETVSEGWLFGHRYTQIGNKGATHRITVRHVPTGKKHTFDVTAPTDRHAWDHVNRHFHGGRSGNSLAHVRTVHLHENIMEPGLTETGKNSGDGTNKMDFPATHQHKGLTYWRTGKLGTHSKTGERTAEYEHDTASGKSGKRVWRGLKTGKSLKESAPSRHEPKSTWPDKKKPAPTPKKKPIRAQNDDDHDVEDEKYSNMNEMSIRQAAGHVHAALQHGAAQAHLAGLSTPDNLSSGPGGMATPFAYGAAHAVDHLTGGRISRAVHGAVNKVRSRLHHEDLDEALEIKHAINHLDRQARHHARKYKEHQGEMNSITNNPEHSHEQALKYQKHAEDAIWHHRQYKSRLAQLDAGKNEDLQELSKDTLLSYTARARGDRNKAASKRDAADEKWEKANKAHRDGTAKTAHTGDYHRQTMKLQGSVSKAAERTIEKRTKGIARAKERLAKEDLDESQDKKGVTVAIPVDIDGKRYSAVNGQAYVHATQTVGNGRWNTSKRVMRRPLKPGPVHDKVIAALEKHKASRDAELKQWYKDNPTAQRYDESLEEGLVTRTINAAKNLYKKSKSTSTRIAQTRDKVGYDKAKSKDLSPRGNALRKVEKIEWAKANPVKKKKDIVPMGKLPDKVWEENEPIDEGRFASVPKMAKYHAKKNWMADFERHVTFQAPEHSGKIDWDTATHLHNKGKTPEEAAHTYYHHVIKSQQQHEDTDLQELSKKTLGSYVKKAHVNAVDHAQAAQSAMDSDSSHSATQAKKYYAKVKNRRIGINRAADKLAKEDLDEGRKLARPKKYSSPRPGGSQALSGMGGIAGMGRYTAHPDPEVNAHAKKAFDAYTSRKFSEVDHHLANAKAAAAKSTYKEDLDEGRKANPFTPSRTSKSVYVKWHDPHGMMGHGAGNGYKKVKSIKKIDDDTGEHVITTKDGTVQHVHPASSAHHRFRHGSQYGQPISLQAAHRIVNETDKNEELEPDGARKLLKELPKRGADGKLSKSKTAQKVEDCIKMSGKKEKIDTEPTLNNLTTPGVS